MPRPGSRQTPEHSSAIREALVRSQRERRTGQIHQISAALESGHLAKMINRQLMEAAETVESGKTLSGTQVGFLNRLSALLE